MSLGPFIRTPLTDIGGSMINHQTFGKCGAFEMAAVDCLEAYGVIRGQKKCIDQLQDYQECHTRDKVTKRFIAMRKERERQIKEGILKGDEKYSKPPKPASFG